MSTNKAISLNSFSDLCRNRADIFKYLMELDCIPQNLFCHKCGKLIKFNMDTGRYRCSGSFRLRKPKKKPELIRCTVDIHSLREHHFFGSKTPLEKVFLLTSQFLWLKGPYTQMLSRNNNISKAHVIKLIWQIRKVLKCYNDIHMQQLGGEGHVVEIKAKKYVRRKFHRGRLITDQWLFGGIDRTTKEAFILPVDKHDASNLLPLIQKHIKPGTTIYSDSFSAFNELNNVDFNFVEPTNGTPHMERLWRNMKASFPSGGASKKYYSLYIAEFFFKKNVPFEERIPEYYKTLFSNPETVNSCYS